MLIQFFRLFLSIMPLVIIFPASAIMQPSTSMVLIQEDAGGGSINVTNTDDKDALLYVKVIDLPDDKFPQLIVTQPVMRVAAGQTQRVRFVLTSDRPLTTEHMKRVTFEGIPISNVENKGVSISLRQNLPVIIHPTRLAANNDAWKELQWTVKEGKLTVRNPGAWVVRMAPSFTLLPGNQKVNLNKSYILPGETVPVAFSDVLALARTNKIRIDAVSSYGYKVGHAELPLSHEI
ncbi:fimbria/pilus periplasmic chaperone [Erwinia rhapontici]|uniref:fimbria/pilus chaperone family protein n=1 Tax=Erwinia rhapontici TaxID=55212 RepID=UPI001D0DA18A|nr:fimbria/pilus chaperone family protein [Erwinia rhapontici]UDQ79807.1 fimbria/pilus periplasmic chaperone [Erwinia rhapontici]